MSEVASKYLSFDDLEALEEVQGVRCEFWHGELFPMTGGTPTHNLIGSALMRILYEQLKDSPCQVYIDDVALRLAEGAFSNKAYPDVMVVCNPADDTVQTSPVLVAEVLSESSVKRDRQDKFEAYTALDSVMVYLIVSQTAVEIELYRRVNDWKEELLRGREAVITLDQPAVTLPLAAIYADVWDSIMRR